jgi:chromate transporter
MVTRDGPPHLTLVQLFTKFLRFGCLAFGGPVAQIAMIRHALIEEERWISGARFNRLLAVMQILPGPEAHELCVHLGMVARGRLGGLLAGLGFMLPGFVLMLGAAWLYTQFVLGQAHFTGALLGVQAVVLALIVRAVQRIGTHIVTGRMLLGLAVLAAGATLANVPFWVLLLVGGVAHAVNWKPGVTALLALGVTALAWWLTGAGTIALVPPLGLVAADIGVVALFIAGLKGGLLTFGGAYTAIPYVRADTVGRGWLSDGAFLDGVAIAGVLPAPLVIFATFAGYVAGGLAGALAITAGIFLPAFAFSMIFFERLEQIVENPALHRVLDGVAAAVVGIIAATCVQLALATSARAPAVWPVILIFVAALWLVALSKSRWLPPALLLGGAIAGWLVFAGVTLP